MSKKNLVRSGNGYQLVRSNWEDFFRPWTQWLNEPMPMPTLTMPAVNITENSSEYRLSLAAPGMKKEDFDVKVEGNLLTISSEKEESKEDKEHDFARCEYNYTTFSRSFTLPEEVKHEEIDAEYKNGVLKLTLPKRKTDKKPVARVQVN